MSDADDILAKLGQISNPLELTRGLFEHAPTPFAIFNKSGHCVLTNPAYRAMFGSEPPPDYSLLKDEVAASAGLTKLFQTAYAGQPVTTPIVWYDPKDLRHVSGAHANKVAIACTLFPLQTAAGSVSHVAITYQDMTAELTARAAAEAERDLLSAIVQQSGDGIIVAAADGAIEIFNPEAERQHGVTRQRVGAADWADAYGLHALDGQPLPLHATPLYQALQGHRVERASWLVRPRNATDRLLSGTATPLKNARGEPAGAVLITRDETARMATERHLRLLAEASRIVASTLVAEEVLGRVAALLVPNVADWCVVDGFVSDGRVARLCVIHGRPEEDEVAARMRVAPQVQAPAAWAQPTLRPRLTAGDVADLRMAGIEVPSLCSLVRVPLRAREREVGCFTLLSAASGRTFTEQDLTTAQELADRAALAADNARLYRQSLEAAQRAESANRAKDEFMAVLGHELRNPLAPIATALEILRTRGPFDKEHKVIARQVQHLRRLVDDLLDVSRITTGKLELQRTPVPVTDLIEQALEPARPLIAQRRHDLTVRYESAADVLVFVDAVRLVQVLVNLLTNAVKFTPPGGAIAMVVEPRDGHVAIHVQDSGIGIEAESLTQVFEVFVQGKQGTDRPQGGLGLGLNIARCLVDLHGGHIEARSAGAGKGSEFIVTLPIYVGGHSTSSRAEEASPLQTAPDARRILLVDDNQDAAELMQDLLQSLGHTVQVAFEGSSAVAVAQSFKPHVAIVDIGLPGMDGYEVARCLRQVCSVPIRLLALTGYGQESDKRRAEEAGFDLHLVKPVALEALAEAIAS